MVLPAMIARSKIFTIAMTMTFLLLQGCASVSYYAQSVSGQAELFFRQTPIDKLLENEAVDAATRHKLQLALELRRFSIEQLGLPDNDSYSDYADLERRYVVWTVFATEEFSLQPEQFCFLIVGCLHYRGYFSEAAARQEQQRLEAHGYDVFIGGVAAYSTLGWFDDPVLNTMLHWSDTYFARVMFHELAHQLLYIKDDTAFNESFADAVALIGVRRWLEYRGDKQGLALFQEEIDREQQFIDLVMRYRQQLQELYESGKNEAEMRSQKQHLFTRMQADYQVLKSSWGEGVYDNWFKQRLNNARLASVSTYRKYTGDMLAIYAELGDNMLLFYDIMMTYGRCRAEQRQTLLGNRRIPADC